MRHPQHCLDAIEEGVVAGGFAGSLKEEKLFTEAVFPDTAKALINVFFAQRNTTKVKGIADLGLKPRTVKKAAVVGGGLMGSGIATALILSNIPVLLKEINDNFLQAGLNRIKCPDRESVKMGGKDNSDVNWRRSGECYYEVYVIVSSFPPILMFDFCTVCYFSCKCKKIQ